MKRLALTAIALLLASPGAGLAALGDSTGAYWGVPGVMNTGTLATVFQCSNPSTTASKLMGVFVFDASGTPVAGNSALVPPGGTRTMSTQKLYSQVDGDYTNLAIGGIAGGTARIGFRQLICAAWVMSPGTNPGYMNPLPILKKTKQRGQ